MTASRDPLDEVRARLEAVFRSTSDAILALDTEGRVTDFNDAAAQMFGFTDETIGVSALDAVKADPSLRERRAEIVRRALAGETLTYEGTRIGADGEAFMLENAIGPMHDGDGRIIGAAAIVREITVQHRAQERERWLAAIVESSRDAIIGLSLDGRILSWNAAAARTFGRTGEEAIGQPARDLFVKEGRQRRHVELMGGVTEGRGFVDEAEQGIRRDGSTFEATITGFPVRGADGGVYAAAFVVRDVTEQRLLEEQLEQARRMEAVGRLAGGVAHDFNNLLTVISGFTGLLRDRDADSAPELEEIERAARRATELTGQLLAFSRQRGSNPVLLDLSAVVAGVMPMLSRLIGEHIRIEVIGDGDLAPVLADEGQIEQVIINLATNARDAMPDGGTLRIETGMADHDHHRRVRLRVSDTGEGIDPGIAGHLFEPFYTTKEQGRGTGLGGADALEAAAARGAPFDALVTDVIMPGLSGPDLAERMGTHGCVRTLFVSGYTADALHDRGNLPAGSAFLAKPFTPTSLLAALRSLLDER